MIRLAIAVLILIGSLATAFLVQRRSEPRATPADPSVAATTPADTSTKAEPRGPELTTNEAEPPLPEAHAWSEALCPAGMVWVGGSHCPRVNGPAVAGSCPTSERRIAVCMDSFEYPNMPGAYPAVMMDYRAARAACKAEHKRLCSDAEWTFACEQQLADARCNVGRSEFVVRTLELAKPERVSAEIAAQDGRLPSRESSCVNGFRVFDLVGNVQEWVESERAGNVVGALKGGRYNQGSIGCSRSIYVSDPWARYPHTGLRCCSDPLAEAPTSR